MTASPPDTRLRMRELVRLTGTSAATIHFYAQQGLLPPARKTAGNQALYPSATIARVGWVRSLQTELNLSLRSIRHVLEHHGELPLEEVRTLLVLGRLVHTDDPVAAAADRDAASSRIDPTDLASLRRLGLVSASTLTGSDLRLIDLVAAMRAAGLTEEAGFRVEGLAVYRDAVERLVAEELARIVEPVLLRHDPEVLRDLVNRALPLTHQLLAVLHQRAVRHETQQWLDMGRASADHAASA
ncbi:MAG: MerR family transcriptional regulator [Candidatus Dormibacteria bacterium]